MRRMIIAILAFLASIFTGCFTDRGGVGGGITSIPPQTDENYPGIEYRAIEINGRIYNATKSAYWPGGTQEKWDLVGPKN